MKISLIKSGVLLLMFVLLSLGARAQAGGGGGSPACGECATNWGLTTNGHVQITSNQPFSCSSLEMTVTSVSGVNYVAQDACGNTYSFNSATAGLTTGQTIWIQQIIQHGNGTVTIIVRAN